MCVEKLFAEESWVRSSRSLTRARVLAHVAVEEISRRYPAHFSSVPTREAITRQGWCNSVIGLTASSGARFILRLALLNERERMSDARSTASYDKEQWALTAAAGRLPVPGVIENGTGRLQVDSLRHTGNFEYAYMLQERIPFASAERLTNSPVRATVLRNLGSTLRKIHQIQTPGWGTHYSSAKQSFEFGSWSEQLGSLVADTDLPLLHNERLLSSGATAWLERRFAEIADLHATPTLFHRDLLGNFGNVLLDDEYNVQGVIDWEFCGGGPAFHFELASLIWVLLRDGHDLNQVRRDLTAVLRGYGKSLNDYRQNFERDVTTCAVLNAVQAVTKYQRMGVAGQLEREPWRELFAHRAIAFVERERRRDLRERRTRSARTRVPKAA